MDGDTEKRKEEFLSIAAHEFRAPMTAIKGYLSMVYDGDGGEIPPKAKKFLQSAIEGNARLLRLVDNMLNIAKLEEGKMVFEMEVVNLSDIIKISFEEFRASADRKSLTYSLSVQDKVSDKVQIDVERMQEVMANLISNAIKYTQEGQVLIHMFNPDSSKVRVEIVDTGFGIALDEQAKLFQKFYRAESSRKKAMGSGLGLFVSKLLMEKFSGAIGMQSEKGRGTTFWFELPLAS